MNRAPDEMATNDVISLLGMLLFLYIKSPIVTVKPQQSIVLASLRVIAFLSLPSGAYISRPAFSICQSFNGYVLTGIRGILLAKAFLVRAFTAYIGM